MSWLLGFIPRPTQGLLSVPTPPTFTIMRSPGLSGPTPDGVPVVMMSPGSSVQNRETNSTSSGTGKINWLVFDAWRFSPLTHPSIDRLDGSTPTAMHGPIGAKVSKPFARVYWTSRLCSSRAVTSLRQVMPRT